MTKGRLEGFSDGVIAILITIMVLELKVPHGTDGNALRPLVPVFLTYVLSFVMVGIYWNNHHHMLHAAERINGKVMWANLHLLFWLSLTPFITGWMGENHFAPLPTALYGAVLLCSGIAYTILQAAVIGAQGPHSNLAAAVGRDLKGKLSIAAYVVAIPMAFVHQWISDALYVAVALLWLVPDRRIEARFRSVLLLGLVACALAPAVARAQTIPPRAYGALRWRLIGPHRGGRVLAVAGVPGDPATFYFGAVDGGVWRTRNAGVTWEPLFDTQPIASIGALALAPSDPNVIYVGTGEASIRSDITYGAGVYKSSDGGAHWRAVGLADTRHIGKVLVDPRNPDVVLVAALGHAYGPNSERGVFRSTDGGRTWTKVLYKDPDTGAIDLAADPADPQIVYAALYQARRTPWEQYAPNEGPGSGLYKSSDGGATWTPLTGHGLPAGPLGRIGLAVGGGRDGRVYALIGAKTEPGLYRSDDRGATWRLAGSDPRLTSRNWYFCRVTVDPENSDVVYVPNVALLESSDGGRTFRVLKGQPGGDDYHELWVDPRSATRMIVGSDQGAVITLDGGRTWSSWFNQPTAQFYHVVTDDAFPYRVYGAQQDVGTAGVASRSDFGEITFRDWAPVGAGESGYIAPDPLDPDLVYGGDTYGGVHRFDRRTGQSQDISPWPVSSFGVPMPQRKYRFTWTSPLVFDRVDRHALYLGAQMVLRTRDGGLHWEAISPDLTGAAGRPTATDTGLPAVADAAARGYGVVYTIAPSPRAAGLLWVGSDDGMMHRTTDGGGHWQNVTPQGLPPWSTVSLLEASPFDTAAAYAAVDRHRVDDFAPYIYRTRDGGAHWTRADSGIAPQAYVQAVRADPERPGLLYAGTETGVYVSFDDGDHWQSLQLNLPIASVRDLAVHGRDLIAATHGRSFWVLDDLTPLRQLGDSALRAPVHLFAPAPGVRLRRSVSNDTPLPPEEPHGANPLAGAVIDYLLQAVPGGPVTLEIRDARGAVVRRFSSEDHAAPPAEPPQIADEWLPRLDPPTRNVGLNRFVWDLRYPPPPAARYGYSIAAIAGQGTVAEPQGPLVLPGVYEVRLGVGGQTYTRSLRVELDPRVHVADSALEAQLRLGLDIWNAMAEQHALGQGLRGARDQLRALAGRSLARATRGSLAALERLTDSLTRAADGAGGELAGLETVVESADREPTRQARAVFTAQHERVAGVARRWGQVLTAELPALNTRLRRQGAPAVQAEEREPETKTGPW